LKTKEPIVLTAFFSGPPCIKLVMVGLMVFE